MTRGDAAGVERRLQLPAEHQARRRDREIDAAFDGQVIVDGPVQAEPRHDGIMFRPLEARMVTTEREHHVALVLSAKPHDSAKPPVSLQSVWMIHELLVSNACSLNVPSLGLSDIKTCIST